MNIFDDEYFMGRALSQARDAYEQGEVPVGAVAVREGRIIAYAFNQVETLKDATAHAEILLLTKVSGLIGDWRLEDIDIYVTKEPCPMCAGALINSRVRRVVFGVEDARFGAAGGAVNLFELPEIPSRPLIVRGILAEECREILRDFFRSKRAQT